MRLRYGTVLLKASLFLALLLPTAPILAATSSASAGCVPMLFIVRHGNKDFATSNDLDMIGKMQAATYQSLITDLITQIQNKQHIKVCPVKLLVTESPLGDSVSHRPYETVDGGFSIYSDDGIKKCSKLSVMDGIANCRNGIPDSDPAFNKTNLFQLPIMTRSCSGQYYAKLSGLSAVRDLKTEIFGEGGQCKPISNASAVMAWEHSQIDVILHGFGTSLKQATNNQWNSWPQFSYTAVIAIQKNSNNTYTASL